MKNIGATLGKKVSFLKIKNAQHDVFLSEKKVRATAFDQMFSWLSTIAVKKE